MVVVMNCAVHGLTTSGSGIGPTGVGCIAGTVTLKVAMNVAPRNRPGLPAMVVRNVRLLGISVSVSVPMPGVTNGGAVYVSGARNAIGCSSPWTQTGWLLTSTVRPVPMSGTGATSCGMIAGGGTVTCSMSPVLISRSAMAWPSEARGQHRGVTSVTGDRAGDPRDGCDAPVSVI